jgi:hypothetical protein
VKEMPSSIELEKTTSDNTMSFDQFWQALTSRLKVKTQIRNWTVDQGYLRQGDFMAEYTTGNYINCDVPDAKTIQKVPRLDVELLHKHWQAYLNGQMSRRQLADKSRFMKYSISILHWFSDDGL